MTGELLGTTQDLANTTNSHSSLNGSEPAEEALPSQYAYLSAKNNDDGGIVNWFQNIDNAPLIAVCISGCLIIMICICLTVYLVTNRKNAKLKFK